LNDFEILCITVTRSGVALHLSIYDIFVFIQRELILFAAIGFLIGGIDELMVDLIWIARHVWRRAVIFTRHKRVTLETLTPAKSPGVIAVFIGAWDESAVIGAMLKYLLVAFYGSRFHVFVGCYPNDPATIGIVKALDPHLISLVINTRDGPTTKADNLNHLWRAMVSYEQCTGVKFKAITLHDAEDVVHPAEPAIYDRMIEQFDFVQLPVHPLPDPKSRWISGHYCDEFAEAHAKAIVVREAIGAAVPAAGVGCAFSRDIIEQIAQSRSGAPFDADTLTEDYELGLRIRALGGRGALIRIRETARGPYVAVRAHFPATISTAVRQKTRWIIGIALAGWDRLGWSSGWFENWMRLRDRQAPLAAIVVLSGYIAFAMYLLLDAWAAATGKVQPPFGEAIGWLLTLNGILLMWRMAIRATFVTREYCWREGVRSIPRVIVGNVIAIMAARRAVVHYWRIKSSTDLTWDKTDHHFPDVAVPQ
jgi:bacteriophage N4 adsorption protein B